MAGGLDLGTSAGGLLLGLPSCNNLTTDSGGGVVCAATDPITSFTAAGDSGGGQSIANGNTLTLIGGKNITTIDAATDQITFNLNDILYSMDDIFATSSGASVYASSTIQGATLFAYTALGIGGTTSPAYPFSLDGKALFDSSEIRFGTTSADRINVTYYARSTTTIPDNTVGSFNIATSTGAGNQSILTITTATNRRATTSARGAFEIDGGAFAYNSYQGVTYADSFQAGPMAFDTDAGILSWVDMPVSTTTANIVMRYSAQIDSSPVLSIYATTTGTGLVNYGSVGIGTTSPIKRFSVSNGGVAVCSLADTSCNDTFTDGDIYATSRSGGAIDVAEWVKVGTSSLDSQGVSTIQPGEVLCTSLHEPRKVVRCGSKEARVPIGVASTRPHLTMGAEYDGPDAVRLALTGRVPVQVNLDGGEIASGDYLALASMEGIAAKATTSGVAIGIALEAFDGNIKRENNSFAYVATGTIEMFINLGYAKLDTAISGGSVASSTFADPQTGELLTLGESLDMDNNDIVNIRGILSANGSWSIDENGNLKVVSIEAERIKTQQLEVGTTDKPFGTTLYDVENGQPYCAYIKAGQLQTVSGTCESNRYLFDKSQAPSTKPQTISNDQNSNTKTETQTNDAAVKEGGEGEQTENPTVSDGASEDSTQQSEPGLVTNDSIIADGDTVSSGDTVDTHKTVEVEGVEPSESEVTSPDPLPSTPTADESYQEHEEATSTSDTSGTQPIESDAIPQDTASDDQNKQETASSTNSSP